MIEAVIFDYGRTIYDPTVDELFPESVEVLEWLKLKGIKLGLVSVALTDDVNERLKDLDRFDLARFFDAVEVIARGKEKNFSVILEKLGVGPEHCIVVGDNLKREITEGNKIGAYTVWTKEKMSNDWQPENEAQLPKMIISNIKELILVVEHLEV